MFSFIIYSHDENVLNLPLCLNAHMFIRRLCWISHMLLLNFFLSLFYHCVKFHICIACSVEFFICQIPYCFEFIICFCWISNGEGVFSFTFVFSWCKSVEFTIMFSCAYVHLYTVLNFSFNLLGAGCFVYMLNLS